MIHELLLFRFNSFRLLASHTSTSPTHRERINTENREIEKYAKKRQKAFGHVRLSVIWMKTSVRISRDLPPPWPKSEQLMTWGRPASEPRAKMLKSSSMHTSTTAARDICDGGATHSFKVAICPQTFIQGLGTLSPRSRELE